MRTLLVVMTILALAAQIASADILPNTWLRGASSVAVNDDATALLINPAGLAAQDGSNTYVGLSLHGEEVAGFHAASKMGFIGLGYDRQYAWRPDGDSVDLTDRAIDTYYAGLALGDRGFSVGFDYRWLRAQFGDEEKAGTWDVGVLYRPSRWLSIGAVIRNASEEEFSPGDGEGTRGCDCSPKATYVAGLALRPVGSVLTLMADASVDRDEDLDEATYTLGAEAMVADGLTLRGSLRTFPESDDRDNEVSFGAWFDFTHLGVGSSYRTHEPSDEGLTDLGVSTSAERQRSILKLGGRIAEIDVEGPLADFRPGWSLFGEPATSAQGVIADINRAALDETVDCILLRIRLLNTAFLGSPPALVQEIHDELVRARDEHGMKILAFLEYGAGTSEYFLASAADWIVMNPASGIEGVGNYVDVMRFTKTTEKIGIEWDYLSAGAYKSTFHSMGAGPLTDEQREEVQSLIDDNYGEMLRAVMDGRGMSRSEAEQVCDGRILIPHKAVEAGLVDEIGFYEDAKAAALTLLEREVPEEREDIPTLSVSGWTDREYDWGRRPVIAVVGAYGSIHEGKGGTDPLSGDRSIGSKTLVRALRAARRDPNVKAVVLRVDSGGGSGLASDIIWNETVKVAKEKPFIVSMGDMAASGGYYIAIEAERIFVEPLTVTGSIGIVGRKPVLAELYNKIDATRETFRSGEHADQFSLSRRMTEEEIAMAEEAIEWFYDDFLTKTSEARGMPIERLRELAEGRVYTGNQALEVGLVDERGGLADAVDYACQAAGVDRDRAVVAYYREGRTWLDSFLGGVSARLGLWRLFDLGDSRFGDLLRLEAVSELPLSR
jgi:protease-4